MMASDRDSLLCHTEVTASVYRSGFIRMFQTEVFNALKRFLVAAELNRNPNNPNNLDQVTCRLKAAIFAPKCIFKKTFLLELSNFSLIVTFFNKENETN